jgi:antitoxin (DNA-binding transcriptional repressor) of toxin-antitoxin stability system
MEPKEIGVFEAKTHLSSLLEEVQKGRTFYLTRRGKRIAELRPAPADKPPLTRGSAANEGYWMAPDFDETPPDLEDYL